MIADAAAYRARLDRVLALADVVKVSEEDLDWLAPGVPRPTPRALLDHGPAVVLLTLGADGALVLTATARAVAAPPVDVVDTIGAGDAFSGGWLAWWPSARLGPRRARPTPTGGRGDGVRLPGRRAYVRAGAVPAAPARAGTDARITG